MLVPGAHEALGLVHYGHRLLHEAGRTLSTRAASNYRAAAALIPGGAAGEDVGASLKAAD